MLTGHQEYVDDQPPDEHELRLLEAKVARLDEALRLERIKTGQIEHGVRELRHLLSPLYKALQTVFGEMDEMGVQGRASMPDDRIRKAWAKWVEHFGSSSVVARFIEAFLEHGELDSDQLNILTKCGKSNVPTYIHRLKKADLIRKNGTKFSLKEL